MEKQPSSRQPTINETALNALDLEGRITQASQVETNRKETKALLQEWQKTMEDPRVKKEHKRITAGVDPLLVEEDLNRLAA
jgi:hypothetical protein